MSYNLPSGMKGGKYGHGKGSFLSVPKVYASAVHDGTYNVIDWFLHLRCSMEQGVPKANLVEPDWRLSIQFVILFMAGKPFSYVYFCYYHDGQPEYVA